MKKSLFFFLFVFLHLFYFQLSAQRQIVVSQAGSSLVNGIYTYGGESNNRPYYNKGVYRIEYRNVGFGLEWEIWDTSNPIVQQSVLYFRAGSGTTPVVSGWESVSGPSPAPRIKNYILFTDGSSFIPSSPTPGTSNNPVGRLYLDPAENGTVVRNISVSFSGTYSGVNNVKLWSSADAGFDAGSDILLCTKPIAATVMFDTFTSSVSASGTYYFITTDLAAGASGTIRAQIAGQESFTMDLGAFSNYFTYAWLSGSSSPLPVELISFDAAAEDSKVLLNWQTVAEMNNYGFEVQRTQDLKDALWEKIGFVEGHGSSSSVKQYLFIDDKPFAGQSWYRIKQIDNDGNFRYYDAITVRLDAPKEYKLMQNSPNPFNPSTAIKFELPINTHVEIKIFDIQGREVAMLVNGEKPAGSHIIYWNGKDSNNIMSSSGIYIYRISAGNFVATRKMSLLK